MAEAHPLTASNARTPLNSSCRSIPSPVTLCRLYNVARCMRLGVHQVCVCVCKSETVIPTQARRDASPGSSRPLRLGNKNKTK